MKMKKLVVCIVILLSLSSCTSSTPIVKTDKSDEYVVVARHMASVFSSLEEAQNEAESRAMAYCLGMGKVYVKKFAIDRPMAIGQVPESSLYFACSAKDDIQITSEKKAESSSSTKKKIEELHEMLNNGLITQEEYKIKKDELLKKM